MPSYRMAEPKAEPTCSSLPVGYSKAPFVFSEPKAPDTLILSVPEGFAESLHAVSSLSIPNLDTAVYSGRRNQRQILHNEVQVHLLCKTQVLKRWGWHSLAQCLSVALDPPAVAAAGLRLRSRKEGIVCTRVRR